MILLATNKRDITTDFIVLELERRGIPFWRLNTEDLPSVIVRFEPQSGWVFRLGKTVLKLRDVKAAYYRRPGAPEAPLAASNIAVHDYVVNEWSAVLRSLWNALEGRWLNSPFSILRAEDKPRQLSEAFALGFNIPETIIGNDFDAVAALAEKDSTIGKPLRHALIETEPNGEVLFTQRLGSLAADDRASVMMAPVIYQREVTKAYDIRATVIGTKIFAVAIHSQRDEETQVDWRQGSRIDLPHEIVTLPDELAQRCFSLTAKLGLRYGAIDLIRDTSDRYWFLEINPNGQWAWIERRTGAPISTSIVDTLMGIAA